MIPVIIVILLDSVNIGLFEWLQYMATYAKDETNFLDKILLLFPFSS